MQPNRFHNRKPASDALVLSPVERLLADVHDAGGELVSLAGELVWIDAPQDEGIRSALESRIASAYWPVVKALAPWWCVGCRKRPVALPGSACGTCRASKPSFLVIYFGGGITVEHAIGAGGLWACGAGVHNGGGPTYSRPARPNEEHRRRLCSRCARELELRGSRHSACRVGRLPGAAGSGT